jgi:hypothetical protein
MKMPWNRKKSANSVDDPARAEAKAYVTQIAWEALAPGFQDKDDVIESVSEMADDDDALALSGTEAAAIVEELWQKRVRDLQEPGEGYPSDDIRVTAAFAELESAGVVARMNLGYDQEEGSDQARKIAKAVGARGFVYFHIQDASRLAYPDATLYLGWDAVGTTREEYDAATIHLGEEIRSAMEHQRLTVQWDGTLASRPSILNVTWRKPLPT